MTKLYFKYGCMNSSKSANLLMIKHNYEEQGFNVLLLKPSIDTRESESVIKSRIGIESKCTMIQKDKSIYEYIWFENKDKNYDVIIVDESQFLTENQVNNLYEISSNIPVICFGLLTDFNQKLFEGSKRLIELSESIQEIKTICKCGSRASINARFDECGNLVTMGNQIEIGGNEKYKALCKTCYKKLLKENTRRLYEL